MKSIEPELRNIELSLTAMLKAEEDSKHPLSNLRPVQVSHSISLEKDLTYGWTPLDVQNATSVSSNIGFPKI